MTPLGKLSMLVKLGEVAYNDDLHIYPGVSEALISWKAARNLEIVPGSYIY